MAVSYIGVERVENHPVTQVEELFLVKCGRNLKRGQTESMLSLRFTLNSLVTVECRHTFPPNLSCARSECSFLFRCSVIIIIIIIIIIVVVVVVIIIIIIISFMQGIYTYIPETNYVPRVYSVAAILLLLSWCLDR